MQDNLSLYHIFYTVARTGSISHSSRDLYISQPAISKAIQKLEQNLDTVLFKRSSRGVTLTPDGELLFEKVKEALSLLDEGENSISHNRSRDIPPIRHYIFWMRKKSIWDSSDGRRSFGDIIFSLF